MPNIVLILTDTQNRSMVGAYRGAGPREAQPAPAVATPALDRLAAGGVRFERAYTTCPLCTPARGAIFTGLHPQVNGAWCNNQAPGANITHMGDAFRQVGWRAGYTGKWHLDGAGYFGDGQAGGGFEPDWWYDGKRYAADLGPERFSAYTAARTPADLRRGGFTEEWIWGTRVANRAIDFLENVGSQPFLLVASFDEPHGPYVAPPEYWEAILEADLPRPPNYAAPLAGKPELQAVHRNALHRERPWEEFRQGLVRFFACNRFVDRQIGRVVDAVERLHPADTWIFYTTDHGDMLGAHGLTGKGPMMYEEITNVPLIARGPGLAAGRVVSEVVSHIDLFPTLLDLAGLEVPPLLHGSSLAGLLKDPQAGSPPLAFLGFHRFAINHDNWGGFYPIRAVTDGCFKLAVNLFDRDELYDLREDPLELHNRIEDAALAPTRDALHLELLAEMDRTRDPFRAFEWGARPWHTAGQRFFWGGQRRNRPRGFSFEPRGVEAAD